MLYRTLAVPSEDGAKREVSRSAGILGNILFLSGPSALLDQLSFHALDWLLH